MLVVTDLRAGTTYIENGDIFEVISYSHIKMGRGSANIKVKVRNLKSGGVLEKSFMNGARVQNIQLDKKELQYLYSDATHAFFMDPVSFEQHSIPLSLLEGNVYLKEGEIATVRFYNDQALSLLLPPKMTIKVKETPPGVRGDSASNVYKEAILENGMKVRVPLFINTGDSVVVDTRDGSYTKRA